MKILITGICGFVGSTLARALREAHPRWRIVGIDNFTRPGSETNRAHFPLDSVYFGRHSV